MAERSTTTGPSYACWRCGQRVLEGCTHHCPTAVPLVAASPPSR